MESLKNKLARLRGELQDAYRAWLGSTLVSATAIGPRDDKHSEGDSDGTGCQTKWLAYLAAKARLSDARAEPNPGALINP